MLLDEPGVKGKLELSILVHVLLNHNTAVLSVFSA